MVYLTRKFKPFEEFDFNFKPFNIFEPFFFEGFSFLTSVGISVPGNVLLILRIRVPPPSLNEIMMYSEFIIESGHRGNYDGDVV